MNRCKSRARLSIKPNFANRQTIDKLKVVEFQFVDRLVNANFQSIIKFFCCKIGH